MAPKRKGRSKRKNAKPKLKATPISMKSPRNSPKDEKGSSEKKREEMEIGLEEEEGREMHLEEEQERENGAEEERGVESEEERRIEREEERGVDLEEETVVDLEEERVVDLEEERKMGDPTDQESQHPRTPPPQKWGQGKSFADMVSHGIEEKAARTDDFKRASVSVRSELVRPVTKPRTSPSSSGHINVISQGSRLPREKSSEERYVEYLEIKKRYEENSAKRKAEEEMKARMVQEASLSLSQAKDFLMSFRKPGEETLNCSMCAGRVASMLKKGGKVLKIDFNHLLNKKYKELALQIGRKTDRNFSWLKPILIKLVEQGMTESEAENAELSFKNIPARIQTVNEFMQNRELIARDVQLLQGARTVYVAAALGRGGFKAHVNAIFSKHDESITFNGGFTLEDLIMLDEERVVVLADPFVPEKTQGNPFGIPLPEHKCNDIKHIWTLLSRFYTRKDANDTEELPLHFDDLRDEMLAVKKEEVSTESFREVIRCSFGLASCMARVLFTKETYTITRQFGIGADSALRDVFEDLPPKLVNWQVNSVKSPIDAVRKVALFGDGISRFQENRFGCLECDRHVLQHGGDHHVLNDMDEFELLTSKEYKGMLHAILKAMIYGGDPHGKYASLLAAYKTLAKYDKQELPTGS